MCENTNTNDFRAGQAKSTKLSVISADISPVEEDTDAAWEVFRALSIHMSNNPDLEDNRYFKDQMSRAHRRWQNMFIAG